MQEETKKTTLEMAELRRQGLTLKEIGEKYGISKQAVRIRFDKLGINPKRPAAYEKIPVDDLK